MVQSITFCSGQWSSCRHSVGTSESFDEWVLETTHPSNLSKAWSCLMDPSTSCAVPHLIHPWRTNTTRDSTSCPCHKEQGVEAISWQQRHRMATQPLPSSPFFLSWQQLTSVDNRAWKTLPSFLKRLGYLFGLQHDSLSLLTQMSKASLNFQV